MDTDIPFLLSLAFIIGGLVVLAKSSDVFVSAASVIARHFRISPLLVGMVIIGFGTSAPELAVSAISGIGGHANLSLGNAYGSCIFNIGAILGVTALIWPIKVKPSVAWFATPLLVGITVLSWIVFFHDREFDRSDGVLLLLSFFVLFPFYCWYDQRHQGRRMPDAAPVSGKEPKERMGWEWFRLFAGLTLLVLSSHILVWGSVDFARDVLHVSDLMIGLTVIAMGTSLPELASAIASARKGENEFVIGNIVGSNFFNTLAVVGIAGTISPFKGFSDCIFYRDLPMMLAMSCCIALFGGNLRHPTRPGCISRWKGLLLALFFVVYIGWTIAQELQ